MKETPVVNYLLLEGGAGSKTKRSKIVTPSTERQQRITTRLRREAGKKSWESTPTMSTEEMLDSAFTSSTIEREDGGEEVEEEEEKEIPIVEEIEEDRIVEEESGKQVKRRRIRDGHFESDRRRAIAFFFVYVFGNAPEEEWEFAISKISARLCMPSGSRSVIKNVFRGVLVAQSKGEHYHPDAGTRSRKANKFLIMEKSTEASLIANTLERGLSVTHATVLVNEFRPEISTRSANEK